jgi:four helix bundle protein
MESKHTFSFEKLNTWQEARKLVKLVYSITASFPKHETYGLVSQMRRASSSISSNISEGSGRTSQKDQAHFYQMSYSSNLELLNHFYTALDLEYVERDNFIKIRNTISTLSAQIAALRKSCFNSTLNSKP